MSLIFLTIALLSAASVRATEVLESIAFASYSGAGLSPTGANGALNSTLWRVDLVQDTNNDNTYGTTKTSAQAPELGRGLMSANFTGGIGAVQINSTTRALFLQPTSSLFTPGFVEFRTKYSSNTTANSLIDVTVEIYFWHLNNAPRASSWKIGFYSGDTPAADVDATDERVWTTPATTSSSPVWTLDKVEFVFQVQYTTGDDYLFVRISGDDAPGTASGERDTIAISAITILAEKAGSSPTTTTGGGGATTTTTTAIGQTTTTTAPTQPGDTTTTGTTAVGDTTAPTSTTSAGTGSGGAVGATTTTVLVTGSTSAGAVASMAALVAFVATMAMAL